MFTNRKNSPQSCTWLFGRGASVANGLSWVVPEEWKADLKAGRVSREDHIDMISKALREKITLVPENSSPYRDLLDIMANNTVDRGHHRLITTNWDYLLQRDVTSWINANSQGVAPRFLSTHSMVYHLNGFVEPGQLQHRSSFLLETDSKEIRKATLETNKAFNYLCWSSLVVIIGMSFKCEMDNDLLAWLGAYEDRLPIGSALFVIVEKEKEALDFTYTKLARNFPRARSIRVNSGFAEWIESGMPELVPRIFTGDYKRGSETY